MHRAFPILCVGLLVGCGATAASAPAPQTPRASAATRETPASTDGTQSAEAESAAPARPAFPPPLPPQMDAGEIARPELLAVLAAGPGRFLQRVHVQAERDAHGRFAGWRILSLFPGETGARSVVQPGDTLLRVNGQSVERPEQLQTVWESLALASELVLIVRRGDQPSELRYRIVQQGAAP